MVDENFTRRNHGTEPLYLSEVSHPNGEASNPNSVASNPPMQGA